MQLTEIRINLCGHQEGGRLKAFCALTFDNTFVVRDVKLIEGHDGLFLAMPSRKLSDHCRRCGEKNHLRARFCNNCGSRLNENRAASLLRNGNTLQAETSPGRLKLHADVAHPINVRFRQELETRVLRAYRDELERSKLPGYVAPRMDEFEDDDAVYEARENANAAVRRDDPHFAPGPMTMPAPAPAPMDRVAVG